MRLPQRRGGEIGCAGYPFRALPHQWRGSGTADESATIRETSPMQVLLGGWFETERRLLGSSAMPT
jgi:hypothetical protein